MKLLIWSGHSEGSQFLLQHFDSSVQDVVQVAVGGVMMYGIFFLARFKPLIHHHYLSIVADHSTVLWPQCTAAYCAMSQSSNHLKVISWTRTCIHCTQTASTVSRSQSKRAHLRCDETADSVHVQPTNLQEVCDAVSTSKVDKESHFNLQQHFLFRWGSLHK